MHNPNISDNLAAIVDRLLEKDPRNRFADASEVAVHVETELLRLPPDTSRTITTRRSSTTVVRTVRSWWRRRSPFALAVTAAIIGLFLISEATKLTHATVLGQRDRQPEIASNNPVSPTVPSSDADTPTRYTLPAGDGAIWSIAFDPCGELIATATEGGTVQFWDAQRRTPSRHAQHEGKVAGLEYRV